MDGKKNRDSFLIYRSFIEAGAEIKSKNDRLMFYEAIFNYALENIHPNLKGPAKGLFMLVKPQLDANRKKFENGNKSKQKEGNSEANDKQNGSKSGTNDNDNDNENKNGNNNANEPTAPHFLNPEIADQVTQLTVAQCRERYDKECVTELDTIGMNLRIKKDELILLQNYFDRWAKAEEPMRTFFGYKDFFVKYCRKIKPDFVQKIITDEKNLQTNGSTPSTGKRIVSHLGYK
jgi:hypothetical protein